MGQRVCPTKYFSLSSTLIRAMESLNGLLVLDFSTIFGSFCPEKGAFWIREFIMLKFSENLRIALFVIVQNRLDKSKGLNDTGLGTRDRKTSAYNQIDECSLHLRKENIKTYATDKQLHHNKIHRLYTIFTTSLSLSSTDMGLRVYLAVSPWSQRWWRPYRKSNEFMLTLTKAGFSNFSESIGQTSKKCFYHFTHYFKAFHCTNFMFTNFNSRFK